jgi:hypothetical protein
MRTWKCGLYMVVNNICTRPKLKNCLFPAPDRPLENVATRNYFLCVICDNFFFFWLPEIVTGSSDIVPKFTSRTGLHFKMNKICCSTLKEPDLWMNAVYFEKKNHSNLPTHRWNGGSGVGNEHIFKGVPIR